MANDRGHAPLPVQNASPRSPIGNILRAWRRRRNLSQLQLALRARVSTRHLSFIETGRARPGRQTILRIAGALDAPHREETRLGMRNTAPPAVSPAETSRKT